MPKLYHSVLQLPRGIEKNRHCHIEARARTIPGVESALVNDDGSFSVYFRNPEVRNLLHDLLSRECRTTPRKTAPEPEGDPEAEARM